MMESGEEGFETVLEFKFGKMVQSMKAIGILDKQLVLDQWLSAKMDSAILENGTMEGLMDMDRQPIQMELMKGISKTMFGKARGKSHTNQELGMKGFSKMVKDMDTESLKWKMEVTTRVTGSRTKFKE